MVPSLEFDSLSLTLLGLALLLALSSRLGLLGGSGPALVHPLLLGKQSEVSRTRRKGESGVYRNWAVGFSGAVLQTRPAGNVKSVRDVLVNDCERRTILGVKATNADLRDQAHLLAAGLISILSTSSPSCPIFNLLPPSYPSLILHLAAAQSTRTHLVTLSSLTLLDSAIDRLISGQKTRSVLVCEASLARDVLEQLIDVSAEGGAVPILVVVGQEAEGVVRGLSRMAGERVKVVEWDDVIGAGMRAGGKVESDLPDPSSIYCISFTSTPRLPSPAEPSSPLPTPPLIQHSTHQHLTAGIAAFLSAFPADKRPSAKDVAALDVGDGTVESERAVMGVPWAMTLMLACVYVGASFVLVDSQGGLSASSIGSGADLRPTLLFLRSDTLSSLNSSLRRSAQAAFRPLYAVAERQKQVGLAGGYLGRDSISEALVWRRVRKGAGARAHWLEQLRAVVVLVDAASSSPSPADIQAARIYLSVPISRFFITSRATGPILTTHYHDLQPADVSRSTANAADAFAHVGAVASNAEVVLKGPGVEALEDNGNPVGQLLARGPTVLRNAAQEELGNDSWTKLDCEAGARANGTFALL